MKLILLVLSLVALFLAMIGITSWGKGTMTVSLFPLGVLAYVSSTMCSGVSFTWPWKRGGHAE